MATNTRVMEKIARQTKAVAATHLYSYLPLKIAIKISENIHKCLIEYLKKETLNKWSLLFLPLSSSELIQTTSLLVLGQTGADKINWLKPELQI